MLNDYFRETMDRFDVKGADLARALGCRHNYISEIRTKKLFPPSDRFWKLLETMDELAPGAKEYFGKLIANGKKNYSIKDLVNTVEPAKLLAAMDDEQLSQFMFAVAARLGEKKREKKNKY